MAEQVWRYQEKPGKFWALTPMAQFASFGAMSRSRVYERDLAPDNIMFFLRNSVVGLGHTPELATRRLETALARPRQTNTRMYECSFIEVSHKLGNLTVIAFTARDDTQPDEWLVEGFKDEDNEPFAQHRLPMVYPAMFGVDVEDMVALNQKVDEWFPR